MRLSEQMLENAKIKKHVDHFSPSKAATEGCGLQLGLAIYKRPRRLLPLSRSFKPNIPTHEWVIDNITYPFLTGYVTCPECERLQAMVGVKCDPIEQVWSVIGHLNDMHKWSILRIAEWVDSIEPGEKAVKLVAEEEEELVSV
jgi:hypothetical protein